jgi:tellurite resistance protein TehA-like permease
MIAINVLFAVVSFAKTVRLWLTRDHDFSKSWVSSPFCCHYMVLSQHDISSQTFDLIFLNIYGGILSHMYRVL